MEKNCIFCQIVNKKIHGYIVAENEYAIAFLDNSCDAYGHTLVVPKIHFDNIMNCEDDYLDGMNKLVKIVARHYIKNCGFTGVNIYNNSGESAGQTVSHFHIHIVPRKEGDDVELKLIGEKKELDMESICKELSIRETKVDNTQDGSVVLYTDGACSGNPGIGGYCAILTFDGKEKVVSGGERETTNNRMELLGIIKGLQALKRGCKVDVYSDSAYVINTFENDWIGYWICHNWRTTSKTEVQNVDLWKQLLKETERHQITWNKVKGHADVELNNRCDSIAREEVRKIKEKYEY